MTTFHVERKIVN